MNKRVNTTMLEWTAILLVLLSVVGLVFQLVAFQAVRSSLQSGMNVAGVPVGGMSLGEAENLLMQVYATPVELRYLDEVMYLEPAEISFRLETETMLSVADTYRTETNFWSNYWDYLWRRSGNPVLVPIAAEYSDAQLTEFLLDVAARYDVPSSEPTLNTSSFAVVPGTTGYSLDLSSSRDVIDKALKVPTNRRVILTVKDNVSNPPTITALRNSIDNYIQSLDFEGIVSLEVVDLSTGEQLSINPRVAYSALSIIKIPIIFERYKLLNTIPTQETTKIIEGSVIQSSNLYANILLNEIGNGDKVVGASLLTSDMHMLGFTNTFMAGYFDQKSKPPVVETLANTRTDVNTIPDPFMQTTVEDMAGFLTMLYQCSQDFSGGISIMFADFVTQEECQAIIELLSKNKIATLIEAGVPEGTRVAHKHGFGEGDTIGDAGIVFSPGGNYVVVLYMWQSEYLEWEYSAPVVANISRMIFSYFNY